MEIPVWSGLALIWPESINLRTSQYLQIYANKASILSVGSNRNQMKTFLTLILLAVSLWSSPVFAQFCNVSSESGETSCTFKTDYTSKNARIAVTYTPQGWAMTVTVTLKEFAMIEGDAKVQTKGGEMYNLEYVSTRRDMAPRRLVKEMPVYHVSEAFLHELGSAKGKVIFLLSAEKPKEVEVKFSSGLFDDIDAFIVEAKTVLADQFKGG